MAIYKATANKTYPFPDFSEQCPLCGGKDCAVRIGFYYRKKLVISFIVYHDVPIARWLCQKKGALKPKHRTFSLLPSALIPYHCHDLHLMFETLNYQRQTDVTFEQAKSFISDKGITTDISIENNQIKNFQKIVTNAVTKLMMIPELKLRIEQADCFDSRDPMATLLTFIDNYHSPFLTTVQQAGSNIEKLSWDFFYNFQTGCYFERQFLFGTPSQKRC